MQALRKISENIREAALNAVGTTNVHADKKPIIEGQLTKLATKSHSKWQQRYFVLYNDSLAYYVDADSEYPKGQLQLNPDYYVSDSLLRPHAFQVSDFDNIFYIAADTDEEKLFWMHTIARVIRNMSQKTDDLPVHYVELDQKVEKYASTRPVSVRASYPMGAPPPPPLPGATPPHIPPQSAPAPPPPRPPPPAATASVAGGQPPVPPRPSPPAATASVAGGQPPVPPAPAAWNKLKPKAASAPDPAAIAPHTTHHAAHKDKPAPRTSHLKNVQHTPAPSTSTTGNSWIKPKPVESAAAAKAYTPAVAPPAADIPATTQPTWGKPKPVAGGGGHRNAAVAMLQKKKYEPTSTAAPAVGPVSDAAPQTAPWAHNKLKSVNATVAPKVKPAVQHTPVHQTPTPHGAPSTHKVPASEPASVDRPLSYASAAGHAKTPAAPSTHQADAASSKHASPKVTKKAPPPPPPAAKQPAAASAPTPAAGSPTTPVVVPVPAASESEGQKVRRPSYAAMASAPASAPPAPETTPQEARPARPTTMRLSAADLAKEAKKHHGNALEGTGDRASRRRPSRGKKERHDAEPTITAPPAPSAPTPAAPAANSTQVETHRRLSYSEAVKEAPAVVVSTPQTTLVAAAGQSGVASKKAMWQQKAESHLQVQKKNPFREGDTEASAGAAPRPGDPNYGRAAEGTATAERAAKAADWVTQEINKLLGVIQSIGSVNATGQTYVCFGPLFYKYTDISDTLVGIMMRAKKRKLINYPGDMLFQGVHDTVEVVVL